MDRADRTGRGASVVVVGGGVTGLSAAWWLARRGVDVLVLEKAIVGWEASGRNGGGCSHHHSPLFVEEQRLWPRMDELLGYATEFRPDRVKIALTERQLDHFRAGAENARRWGFASEPLAPAQVRELVPLTGDNVLGGVLFRFGGHANPHRTVQAYAWALQDLGGRIAQHTPVTGFRTQGGRVVGVTTPKGEFGCDHLVLAVGPQTGELAAALGVELPLAFARAEILVTEPLEPMPHGGSDGNGLYGRQTLRGNLVYGGGPHEWLEDAAAGARPAATPLCRSIAARLFELFPKAAHARVIRSWAGIVENTPDGRPVIDRLKAPANVVLATLSSVGFGLSPASGRAIADLVTEGACTFADLSTLALDRFKELEPGWRERRGWVGVADAGSGTGTAPARASGPRSPAGALARG